VVKLAPVRRQGVGRGEDVLILRQKFGDPGSIGVDTRLVRRRRREERGKADTNELCPFSEGGTHG